MTCVFVRIAAVGALVALVALAGVAPAVAHARHHHRHVRRAPPVARTAHPIDDSNAAYWRPERERSGRGGPVEIAGGDLVAAMRRVLGMRRLPGFHTEWCGDVLGWVARRAGYAVPVGYPRAAAWVHAGPRLHGPRAGAVAVWAHHVGVVERWPVIISGNFGHRVAEGTQRHQQFLGFYALIRT